MEKGSCSRFNTLRTALLLPVVMPKAPQPILRRRGPGRQYAAGTRRVKALCRQSQMTGSLYTTDSRIEDVMHDPVFGDYGRLIFPADTAYWSGDTLAELRLTWYSNIDPDKTVEIVNYLREHAQAGRHGLLRHLHG